MIIPVIRCNSRAFLQLVAEWYDLCIGMHSLNRLRRAVVTKFPHSGRRHTVKTISTENLKALKDRNSDLTLVNTLAADAFQKTKIPGAINVPLESDDFTARVEQAAGDKSKPVVVYCASSQCNSSEKAARKLESAGFTAVSRYTGGAAAWQKEADAVASEQCC
jgi:rhodanese-related sulfurtransferase